MKDSEVYYIVYEVPNQDDIYHLEILPKFEEIYNSHEYDCFKTKELGVIETKLYVSLYDPDDLLSELRTQYAFKEVTSKDILNVLRTQYIFRQVRKNFFWTFSKGYNIDDLSLVFSKEFNFNNFIKLSIAHFLFSYYQHFDSEFNPVTSTSRLESKISNDIFKGKPSVKVATSITDSEIKSLVKDVNNAYRDSLKLILNELDKLDHYLPNSK